MTDAEGIRNLVGTGLVQLVGGVVTAIVGLIVLFNLNWQLTLAMLFILGAFGGMMAVAFGRIRPLFRARGELNADATGRLAESLGRIRIVKVYVAEEREERARRRHRDDGGSGSEGVWWAEGGHGGSFRGWSGTHDARSVPPAATSTRGLVPRSALGVMSAGRPAR